MRMSFGGLARPLLIWPASCGALWAVCAIPAMAPGTVAAQESSSSSESSSTTKLPEVRVIATTPVAPPARRAPAARTGTTAPVESRSTAPAVSRSTAPPASRSTAPAASRSPAPAPAPAESTAASSQSGAQPGAVDLDKIPSNVQTAPASDFSYTKTPDLLQSMVRALPGVSLSVTATVSIATSVIGPAVGL